MKKRERNTKVLIVVNAALLFVVICMAFMLKTEMISGGNVETQQESTQAVTESITQVETTSAIVTEAVTETQSTVSETKGYFYDEWQGKKVAWYGDSLTELYYHCDIVNEYFGFEGYNCGIRGSSVAYMNENSLCLSSRMTAPNIAIPPDVEVIFIMAGTNDWCGNIPLGDKRLNFDEEANLRVDNTTFYGACHEMFNNLTLMYPDAYILVMGSPFGASNVYNIYNELDLSIFDYGDALCEAASMWGIPSFNIGEMMGINVNNVSDSKALMYEGIHFVEGGARMAADVIIEELARRKYYK